MSTSDPRPEGKTDKPAEDGVAQDEAPVDGPAATGGPTAPAGEMGPGSADVAAGEVAGEVESGTVAEPASPRRHPGERASSEAGDPDGTPGRGADAGDHLPPVATGGPEDDGGAAADDAAADGSAEGGAAGDAAATPRDAEGGAAATRGVEGAGAVVEGAGDAAAADRGAGDAAAADRGAGDAAAADRGAGDAAAADRGAEDGAAGGRGAGNAAAADRGAEDGAEPDRTDGDAAADPGADGDGKAPADGATPDRPGGFFGISRSPAALLVGLLLGLLGFALAVQVRSNTSTSGLPAARQEDLVRILDDLSSREDRLRRQIAELEAARTRLSTTGDRSSTALEEARTRSTALGILAGTVAAQGPGIELVLTDPERRLAPEDLLDAVEELRAAGAEAIQVGGVRIGLDSAFTVSDRGIAVDGVPLAAPYTILAIGDPPTLATAMDIPGGVSDTTGRAGGRATVLQRDQVVIRALRVPRTPRYSQPAD